MVGGEANLKALGPTGNCRRGDLFSTSRASLIPIPSASYRTTSLYPEAMLLLPIKVRYSAAVTTCSIVLHSAQDFLSSCSRWYPKAVLLNAARRIVNWPNDVDHHTEEIRRGETGAKITIKPSA